MSNTFGSKLKHAWSVFKDQGNPYEIVIPTRYPVGTAQAPMRRFRHLSEKSIVTGIYNRLSIDVASIPIRHVRVDEDGRYISPVNSKLQDCLLFEPNIDQSARHFRQDIAYTLFDNGVAALVPVETVADPLEHDGFDVIELRVGEVTEWFPEHVRVSVYNKHTGRRQDVVLPKKSVAIVVNPLYAVMNEPNSTLQRLIRKLTLLDVSDDRITSGKMDLIIQLPYVVKSQARKEQADLRRNDIVRQLTEGPYGIAYTDGTEKITQLNRPVENNLLKQVEYLTEVLYNQLGLTESIMNGTADQQTMTNYRNRTIEPIVSAVTDAMTRTFLSKTARTQGQRIKFFTEPFSIATLNDIGVAADKLIRNEIVTANEMRGFIGLMASSDTKANELRNPNMPAEQPTE